MKERFDEEGISIPYPQSDLHIIQENAQIESLKKEESETTPTKRSYDAVDVKDMDVSEDW